MREGCAGKAGGQAGAREGQQDADEVEGEVGVPQWAVR